MARAELLEDTRYPLSPIAFVEIRVWRLPRTQPGCNHNYKYSLSLTIEGTCVMRFDNEAGKGDHQHSGRKQYQYRFAGLDELYSDFWTEVETWRPQWKL